MTEQKVSQTRRELQGYLNKLAVELGYGKISVSDMQKVIPAHVVAASKLAEMIDKKVPIPEKDQAMVEELIRYYQEDQAGYDEESIGKAVVDYRGSRGIEKPVVRWPWKR